MIYRIGDLGRVVTGRTPPTEYPEYFGKDYLFITPSDMDGRHIISETERGISEKGAKLIARCKVPPRSVAVSCIGWQMGKVILTGKDAFTNQQLNTIIPNQLVVPEFLYYSLSTRRQELKLLGSVGTRTPILNKSVFEQIKIVIPPIETQRQIAAILSAYDDLIENNTRRIKLLEQAAHDLYREWFVHFRFPGHEQVAMVESPLGLIPEGWTIKEMAEITHVIDCLHSKKPDDIGVGNNILLQVWNIADNGKLDLSSQYLISDEDYRLWTSRVEVSVGDCVITNVGRIGAVAQIPRGLKAAIGRNMTAVRCVEGIMTPTFLIQYLLSSHMEQEKNLKKDSGTIMDSLNVKGINRLRVIVPPFLLMQKFEAISRPLHMSLEVMVDKITNLRQTRELLLPRLVAGEVDLSELEIIQSTKEL